MFLVLLLAGLIMIQRLLELRLAARNRAWALAAGAQEVGAGHYPLFFLLHTSWLVGWVVEAMLRGPALGQNWYFWLGLFGASQGLRYWCIASLGRFWNTRILIIPGAKAVRRGPYRFLAHPNYLAVAFELLSVPLIFGAWLAALVATILNAVLLLGVRIPAEEKALQLLEKEGITD
jgi:methyltransferase